MKILLLTLCLSLIGCREQRKETNHRYKLPLEVSIPQVKEKKDQALESKQKQKEIEEVLFIETSRDPYLKVDEKQKQRIIFFLDPETDTVEFSLGCLLKDKEKESREFYSDRSIGLHLPRGDLDYDKPKFVVPENWVLTLKVSQLYYSYNDPQNPVYLCVETLKQGQYEFHLRDDGFFEVHVDNKFYMYMKKS